MKLGLVLYDSSRDGVDGEIESGKSSAWERTNCVGRRALCFGAKSAGHTILGSTLVNGDEHPTCFTWLYFFYSSIEISARFIFHQLQEEMDTSALAPRDKIFRSLGQVQ